MGIEIKTIETKRATMKYFSFGKGDKNLVLVPGVGIRTITLAPELVAGYYAPFSEDYTVYVFDIREELPDVYSIDGMAEDLYAALKELNIDKAFFNGCSMGGMILQRLEVLHPDIVAKAVLSSTTYHISERSQKVIENWLDLTAKGELKQLGEVSSKEVYTEEYYNKFYDALIDYHVGASDLDCKRFATQLSAILNFKDNDLAQISPKTLVIAAKGDKTFDYNESIKMAEQIGCEIYVYDGFSHAVYDEAPDFLERIKAFYEK